MLESSISGKVVPLYVTEKEKGEEREREKERENKSIKRERHIHTYSTAAWSAFEWTCMNCHLYEKKHQAAINRKTKEEEVSRQLLPKYLFNLNCPPDASVGV